MAVSMQPLRNQCNDIGFAIRHSPTRLPTVAPPTDASPTAATPTEGTATTPTPGTNCNDEYGNWVECTVQNFSSCGQCDRSSPGLESGRACDKFDAWYESNLDCCAAAVEVCNMFLDDLKDCKNCSPVTTPTQTPPSSTAATPTEPSDTPTVKPPTNAPPSNAPQPGKITGVVFVDTNGNGMQDAGEPCNGIDRRQFG